MFGQLCNMMCVCLCGNRKREREGCDFQLKEVTVGGFEGVSPGVMTKENDGGGSNAMSKTLAMCNKVYCIFLPN